MSSEYDIDKVKRTVEKIRNRMRQYDKKIDQIQSSINTDVEVSDEQLKSLENYFEEKLENYIELKNSVSRNTIDKAERSKNSARLQTLKRLLF